MSTINLIARDNGFGLSRDLRLLQTALTASGHAVSISAVRRGRLRKLGYACLVSAGRASRRLRGRDPVAFDLNLMLEHVRSEFFPQARANVLMPNPEWFLPADRAVLSGVDCVFVGPADLAASLGHLGDSKHPQVQAAIARIVEAAGRAGIPAGIFALDVALARQYREVGFRVIALAADIIWLVRATRSALQEVRS